MKPLEIANQLFNEYKEINEKVPMINWGGCGIFAEHLYKTLTNLGLSPKFVVITADSKAMNRRIKGLQYSGWASVHHVVIKLGSRYIDSEGIYKSLNETKYAGRQLAHTLSLAKLQEWNANANMWNDEFNRRHIKTIENKLKKCYEKISKSLVVTI